MRIASSLITLSIFSWTLSLSASVTEQCKLAVQSIDPKTNQIRYASISIEELPVDIAYSSGHNLTIYTNHGKNLVDGYLVLTQTNKAQPIVLANLHEQRTVTNGKYTVEDQNLICSSYL